ncbi:MAG: glycoside hydrolase family 16 protein [Patescibacteria group bacterium]
MEKVDFTEPTLPEAAGISRRSFLRVGIAGLAAVGADILLPSCGGDEQQPTAPENTPPTSEAPKTVGEFGAKPSWVQNFAAMRSGSVDRNVWRHETDPAVPTYNDEAQAYTENNVRIERGRGLLIEARRQPYRYPNGPNHKAYGITSGRIDTRDSLSFEYGKFEVEMKMPEGKGTWPAFWFLSANQAHTTKLHPTDADWEKERFYLHDGELDVVEYYGHTPGVVEATLHAYAESTEGHVSVADAEDAFHTYGVEVTPTEVRWTIDGKTYFKREKPSDNPDEWPFGNGNQFYAILNLAMGGSGGGEVDDSKSRWTMEVKSAAFYEYTDKDHG